MSEFQAGDVVELPSGNQYALLRGPEPVPGRDWSGYWWVWNSQAEREWFLHEDEMKLVRRPEVVAQ